MLHRKYYKRKDGQTPPTLPRSSLAPAGRSAPPQTAALPEGRPPAAAAAQALPSPAQYSHTHSSTTYA